MSLAKLLVATAIAAAPLSVVAAQSGQSGAPADSGSNHAPGWIAGTGAVAGAGLFLAFTQSHHDGSANNSGVNLHSATTGSNGPAANGGTTPPNPGSTPSDTDATTPQGTQNNPPVVDDSTSTQTDGPFTQNIETPNTPSPNDEPGFIPPDASTVPEPGSLALLATGIVGLAPLARKRRK